MGRSLGVAGLGLVAGLTQGCGPAEAGVVSSETETVMRYNTALCEAVGTYHAILTQDLVDTMHRTAIIPSFTAEQHPLNWAPALDLCVDTQADPRTIAENLNRVLLPAMQKRIEARAELAGTRSEWAELETLYEDLAQIAKERRADTVELPDFQRLKQDSQAYQVEVLAGWDRLKKDCSASDPECWKKKLDWLREKIQKFQGLASSSPDAAKAYDYSLRLLIDLGGPPSFESASYEDRMPSSRSSSEDDEPGTVSFGPALVIDRSDRGSRMRDVDPQLKEVNIGFGFENPYLMLLERIHWAITMVQMHADLQATAETQLMLAPRKRQIAHFDASAAFAHGLSVAKRNFSSIAPLEPSSDHALRLNASKNGYDKAIQDYIVSLIVGNEIKLDAPEGKRTKDQWSRILGFEQFCPSIRDVRNMDSIVTLYSDLCSGFFNQGSRSMNWLQWTDGPWDNIVPDHCLLKPEAPECAATFYRLEDWGTSEDPRRQILKAI